MADDEERTLGEEIIQSIPPISDMAGGGANDGTDPLQTKG